jgi:hypothetical protein
MYSSVGGRLWIKNDMEGNDNLFYVLPQRLLLKTTEENHEKTEAV